MFITKENFENLRKQAISCLKTKKYCRYRLIDGTILYDYLNGGYRKVATKK